MFLCINVYFILCILCFCVLMLNIVFRFTKVWVIRVYWLLFQRYYYVFGIVSFSWAFLVYYSNVLGNWMSGWLANGVAPLGLCWLDSRWTIFIAQLLVLIILLCCSSVLYEKDMFSVYFTLYCYRLGLEGKFSQW